jgi:hypothetical protein
MRMMELYCSPKLPAVEEFANAIIADPLLSAKRPPPVPGTNPTHPSAAA